MWPRTTAVPLYQYPAERAGWILPPRMVMASNKAVRQGLYPGFSFNSPSVKCWPTSRFTHYYPPANNALAGELLMMWASEV